MPVVARKTEYAIDPPETAADPTLEHLPLEPAQSDAQTAKGPRHEPDPGLADIRISFGKYFVVLIAGRERRGKERRKMERQTRPIFARRNLVLLFVMWCSLLYTCVSLLRLGVAAILNLD